jgi:hypothetical protein
MTELQYGQGPQDYPYQSPRIRITMSYGAAGDRPPGVPETADIELNTDEVSAADIVQILTGLGEVGRRAAVAASNGHHPTTTQSALVFEP